MYCRLDLIPPLADQFICGVAPSITDPSLSSCPSDSTSRWTPCPPKYCKWWLQVRLWSVSGFRLRARLGLSIPATFSGQRRIIDALGYSAPHPSARGTSTLPNNALLSAKYTPVDSITTRFTLSLRRNSCSRSRSSLNVQNWPNSVITLFDFWGPGSGHKHAATLYAHPGRRFGSILLSRLTSSAAGEGRVRQQLTIFLHVLSASRQRLHSVVPSCRKHPTRVRTTFTKRA